MEKACARAEALADEIGYPAEIMQSAIHYMSATEKARLHFARIKIMEAGPLLRAEAGQRLKQRREARMKRRASEVADFGSFQINRNFL